MGNKMIGDVAAAAPACVYLLADHLDAVLAAGEDLLGIAVAPAPVSLRPDPAAGSEPAEASAGAGSPRPDLRIAVEKLRALELTILGRVLKARDRARELAAGDSRFSIQSRLFVGGTAPLVDAVAECADTSLVDFETGDALPAYLRSRGLIGERKCALVDDEGFAVGEDFLVAARISLGGLLDMVASFLDALEAHFELYAGADADAERAEEAAAEDVAEDDADASAPTGVSAEARLL